MSLPLHESPVKVNHLVVLVLAGDASQVSGDKLLPLKVTPQQIVDAVGLQ